MAQEYKGLGYGHNQREKKKKKDNPQPNPVSILEEFPKVRERGAVQRLNVSGWERKKKKKSSSRLRCSPFFR